jgi:hypothetical protein
MTDKTWREIVAEIPDIVRADIANGAIDITNEDHWVEYANEWADGSQYVIYYHHAIRLWAESTEVQECEPDAWDYMNGQEPDITKVMSVCVYMALSNRIMEAIQEISDEEGE